MNPSARTSKRPVFTLHLAGGVEYRFQAGCDQDRLTWVQALRQCSGNDDDVDIGPTAAERNDYGDSKRSLSADMAVLKWGQHGDSPGTWATDDTSSGLAATDESRVQADLADVVAANG